MKQKLQDLKAYIKVLEKNRIVKWIAVFIAVMIILTIGSRVTYNIITPKVLTEPAASAVIDHSADIEGVVTSVSEEPVILEAGLLVTRVIVMEGQLIKKGDTLLEIDKESLNRIIPSLQGAELSRYTAIKAAGGKVKSSCSGMVSRVNAEAGSYTLGNAAVDMKIEKDFVDVRIDAKEGFAVAMENNLFVILDTNLDADLIDEGFARELISKVQQLRKQKGLEMMDNISITIAADDEISAAVKKHKDYIMKETLALKLEETDAPEEFDHNGHKTGIAVEKM